MTISIDPSVLLGWYQSFYGGTGTGVGALTNSVSGTASVSAANIRYAPTPPWDPSLAQPSESQLVQSALGGQPLIDPNAAQLDLPGASADYKNLFALYQELFHFLLSVFDFQLTGASS